MTKDFKVFRSLKSGSAFHKENAYSPIIITVSSLFRKFNQKFNRCIIIINMRFIILLAY